MPSQVLIIGGGLMAGSDQDDTYSHAHAIQENPDFELVGFVEPSSDRKQALQRWQVPVYKDLSEVQTAVDCVVVASPDHTHVSELHNALQLTPKVVICEKPLSKLPEQGQTISMAYAKANIPLIINYSRRYVPVYEQLKTAIEAQGHLATTIYYAKGIQHNGVHALDLVQWLYGDIRSYQIFASKFDYSPDDPTVSCSLVTQAGHAVVLQGLDERAYTHFEIDVLTCTSRYRIYQDHSVLETHQVQSGQGKPKGKRLVQASITTIDHERSLQGLYQHAHRLMKAPEQTPVQSQLQAEALAFKLAKQAIEMKADESLSSTV